MSHHCHAHGCKRTVPPRLFMCPPHWKALPAELKRAVLREYRPGQEKDKKPSARYLAVQQRAVGWSAFKPNDEACVSVVADYIRNSEMWRKRAIDAGEGDPCIELDAALQKRLAKQESELFLGDEPDGD